MTMTPISKFAAAALGLGLLSACNFNVGSAGPTAAAANFEIGVIVMSPKAGPEANTAATPVE
jgi:hypothetical protein